MKSRNESGGLLHRTADAGLPVFVRGEGLRLYDADGNEFLDGISAGMAAGLGQTNPAVVEAMASAASQIPYVHDARGVTPYSVELAQRLGRLAPAGLRWVYLTGSGSDAIEAAFRIAWWYQRGRERPHRTKVLATSHGYHGSTLAALSATGIGRVATLYATWSLGFEKAPSPFCYHCPLHLSFPECRLRCAEEVDAATSGGRDDKAAFILEPVIGNAAGSVVTPAGYLSRVAAICRERDVLLIADEIATGLGRTGLPFAVDHDEIVPDILTVGKGLCAGYANMSAVLVHERVVEALPREFNLLGHTYNGHPIAAAAACMVLRRLEEGGLVDNALSRGRDLLQRLAGLSRHRIVGDVRGRGLLASVELVESRATRAPFDPARQIATRVARKARERRLLVLHGQGCADGACGDHVTLAPALSATAEDVREMAEALDEAVHEVASEVGLGGRE